MVFFEKMIWCDKFQEKQLGRSKVTTHPAASTTATATATTTATTITTTTATTATTSTFLLTSHC